MKLALGTVQFGLDYGINNFEGQVLLDETKKILKIARRHKIKVLDTAPVYGESEAILGSIGVKNFDITTKTIPLKTDFNQVTAAFIKSLEKLKIEKVHGLLIHDLNDMKKNQFHYLYNALKLLKKEGLTKKIGFSAYSPDQVDFLLENFDFDIIQIPFNVFDIRLQNGNQLKKLKKNKVEVHARSIFLQGLLLNFDNLSNYFTSWRHEFDNYQKIVKESGLTKLEYALNFALNSNYIDKLVIGVNSAEQLLEIIKAEKKNEILQPFSIDDSNLLNPANWKIS